MVSARARARRLLTDRARALVRSLFMRKNLSGTRIAEGAAEGGHRVSGAQAWEGAPLALWLRTQQKYFGLSSMLRRWGWHNQRAYSGNEAHMRRLTSHIGLSGNTPSGFLSCPRNRNISQAAVRGACSSNEPGVQQTVLPYSYSRDADSAYTTVRVLMQCRHM